MVNWNQVLNAPSATRPKHPEWMGGRDWSIDEEGVGILRALVTQIAPNVAVESGTFLGVGTAVIASAMHHRELGGGHLWTVDFGSNPEDTGASPSDWQKLADQRAEVLDWIRKEFHRVDLRFENGHTRDVLPRICALENWDFWFQDSGHLYGMIEEEWNIMRPYANPGAVAVFDDIMPNHPWFTQFQVPEGWAKYHTSRGHGMMFLQKTC